MPGTYAATTTVSVSKSFDEIKRTLMRFGASSFGFEEMDFGSKVIVRFIYMNVEVRLAMDMPPISDYRLTESGRERPQSAIDKDWEQACRQRWRTLSNAIKAKLALVDDGISSVEREFLADIVTPNGMTVGELMLPRIKEYALPETTGR